QLIGPKLVQNTTEKISQTKDRLKAARDLQKSYADKRMKPLEFSVGDYVLLKLSPWKGLVRFGKKGKLALRFVRPFDIVEKVGPVAYRRKPLEFSVGDYVLLKLSPWKGLVRFGKKGKLALRFVRPFDIVEKVGPVAYWLDFPEELNGVHDTFHVSNLKKCLADPTLQVPLDKILWKSLWKF
nr:hypothetical protein [Tanacetum cinerariifolium]